VIGFGASVYKAYEVWFNLRRFSWKEVDKYANKLIDKINEDQYQPDLIVTIGRGGAIIGAILSGNLSKHENEKNIPLLGLDRVYKWEDGNRIEIKNEMIDFQPLKDKNILLVASDVVTGSTMRFFIDEISAVKVNQVRTACLVKGMGSSFIPHYWGKEIPTNFIMPWMYKGHGYVRDSRKDPAKVIAKHK
jgi:hypoxanthine phosphoribosyltransferase